MSDELGVPESELPTAETGDAELIRMMITSLWRLSGLLRPVGGSEPGQPAPRRDMRVDPAIFVASRIIREAEVRWPAPTKETSDG